MALIVQDDTGLIVDANAYVSVAFFRDYCTTRSKDLTGLADADIEALIIQATSYIDVRFKYNGAKSEGYSQTTEFPRSELYSKESEAVTGLPREVKSACVEYGFIANTQSLFTDTSASEKNVTVKMDKVDVIETRREFSSANVSSSSFNVFQLADQLLKLSGFICSQSPTTYRA